MTDPVIVFTVAIASGILCVWQTINHCADAQLDGSRKWWSKALFRAKQRVEYREYSREVERNEHGELTRGER